MVELLSSYFIWTTPEGRYRCLAIAEQIPMRTSSADTWISAIFITFGPSWPLCEGNGGHFFPRVTYLLRRRSIFLFTAFFWNFRLNFTKISVQLNRSLGWDRIGQFRRKIKHGIECTLGDYDLTSANGSYEATRATPVLPGLGYSGRWPLPGFIYPLPKAGRGYTSTARISAYTIVPKGIVRFWSRRKASPCVEIHCPPPCCTNRAEQYLLDG